MDTLKFLTLGDSNCGKTCFVMALEGKPFDQESLSTVGVDYAEKKLEDGTRLQIWDTAGQERFRTITQNYYRACDAILMFYDIGNRTSFNHVSQWIAQINDANVKILLLGNKCDLPAHRRQVTTEEGQRLSTQFQDRVCGFFEVSAKQNLGVQESVDYLVKKCKKKQRHVSFQVEESIRVFESDEAAAKKSFCC